MLLGSKNVYVYLSHNSSEAMGVQINREVLFHAIQFPSILLLLCLLAQGSANLMFFLLL